MRIIGTSKMKLNVFIMLISPGWALWVVFHCPLLHNGRA
jgi:membrane protein DedA with SNARE-associated domain